MTTQASERAPGHRRRRVFYVSYDGIGEPLGRSQVLAYLFRLADRNDIVLFSFEKPGADRAALEAELRSYGIEWHPLSYHKNPPVLSTLLDVLSGWRELRRAASERPPDLVHVRSYVPALIAVWASHWTSAPLLFDIRGFWVDERVEGGIWPRDRALYRLLYRIAKRCERRFFTDADAIVTLTNASVAQIRMWTAGRDVPVAVIPTCTEVERFAGTTRRPGGPELVWCGSIGTWYRFDLARPLAVAFGMKLDVITRQTGLACEILGDTGADVSSLAPAEIPGALHAGDIGLSLCVSSFSKLASTPTRFAEYLAAGMPVIVNPGIGDLVEIVEARRVGVVIRDEAESSLRDSAAEMRALLADPELTDRCRAVARELFDVDDGARRYAELYDRLAARAA